MYSILGSRTFWIFNFWSINFTNIKISQTLVLPMAMAPISWKSTMQDNPPYASPLSHSLYLSAPICTMGTGKLDFYISLRFLSFFAEFQTRQLAQSSTGRCKGKMKYLKSVFFWVLFKSGSTGNQGIEAFASFFLVSRTIWRKREKRLFERLLDVFWFHRFYWRVWNSAKKERKRGEI